MILRGVVLVPLVVAGLCFLALNLLTALRGTATTTPRELLRGGGGGANVTTATTSGRYSKIVLAEASSRPRATMLQVADRVEQQIDLAEAAAARLDAAAAAAELAMASLIRRKEKDDEVTNFAAAAASLATCASVDLYQPRRNQTVCIPPELQVSRRVRVRLVPKGERGGKRAFFLLTQGLRQHPAVTLVGSAARFCADHGYRLDHEGCERDVEKIGEDHSHDADIAIVAMPANDPKFFDANRILAYSPYRWGTNKKLAQDPIVSIGNAAPEVVAHADENPTLFRYAPPVPRERVVFVDECDWSHPHPHVAPPYLAYFKRSWVEKTNSVPTRARVSAKQNYFPTPYALADEYLDATSLPPIATPRTLDVVCTLRDTRGGRGRVQRWLRDRFVASPRAVVIGQLSSAGRTTIDRDYLAAMRRAKIVVTCNPTGWEGDFRLFEAMSSGALVFVDKMLTPYHHPLIDGRHLVYYDNENRSDFLAKLDHALRHPRWARTVALRGFAHVLKHHRAVSWVDYILRTSLTALAERHDDTRRRHPTDLLYTETGQHVLRRTRGTSVVHHRDHGALVSTPHTLADDDSGPSL
ncbi:hypothetical protein CTAYLR_002704 [Chrysophaeum taylorii]|uniref:Spore protein YkvP/CgeB glycosyl transferase-like domain-containing protein n=1 Tax=Chrysophaeum taylorii TaxID=2483200 RepID=A0AAD7UDD7_9STRA|nr:hypothetical protein CTAYLR_002704 [Chrysophaeum taylorii]